MLKSLRSFNLNQNEHGQALHANITQTRVSERDIDLLLGLCQGVMADGVVTKQEAEFLLSWIKSNQHIADQWPANVLYKRLQAVLEDGVLDLDEEREILALILDISGVKTSEGEHTSVSLPYCNPMPEIIFNESTFCVTGKFASGTRREVESEIIHRGGQVIKGIVKHLDYLVIGEYSSRDWAHKTFGRKIEKAIAYRDQGIPVTIVSEEHWIKYISNDSAFPPQEPESLAEALNDRLEDFRSMGWHVNINENACTLHRFFKNGKPRKGPTVSIQFEEFIANPHYELYPDEFADEKRKSTKPWAVWCAETNYSSEFKSLSAAAKRFIALANTRESED